jgi:hypothetical protein
MVQVPEGTISEVDSVIDAKIENVGFDRIFVALPSGWVIDDVGTFANSYAVITVGLWRKYGDPFDRSTPLGSGLVYDEEGTPTKLHRTLNGRVGWWLRPNEGMHIHVAIDNLPGSGVIDPLAIEKENPSILVKKWEQEFIITPSATGFITAPWVVEGAALTLASPAPISDVSQKPGPIYYMDYDPKKDSIVQLGDVPSWDAWFTLTGSLSTMLSKKSIVGLEPVLEEVETEEAVVTQTPVWRIDDLRDITYIYEWERGKRLTGIELIKGVTLAEVPEWFDWF